MGGLRWRVGHRVSIDDHRFDAPVVRPIADGVDGRRMSSPRCVRCKGGLIPDVLVVQVREALSAPSVVLSCATCHVVLSAASLRTLNHERLAVVRYE
jgi:hypothetical protein